MRPRISRARPLAQRRLRSWVMKSRASRSSRRRRSSKSRICSCTVTSSAVVGSSAISSRGQRHGNHDPLPKSPGELVRKLFCTDFGFRDCGAPQGFDSPAFRFVGTQLRLMRAYRFFNLCAGAYNRVQRGHGLLKDHGNLTAANVGVR